MRVLRAVRLQVNQPFCGLPSSLCNTMSRGNFTKIVISSYSCASYHRVFAWISPHLRKPVTWTLNLEGWCARMPVVTLLWDLSPRFRFQDFQKAHRCHSQLSLCRFMHQQPLIWDAKLVAVLLWPRHEEGILFWVQSSLDKIFLGCLHWRGSLRYGPRILRSSKQIMKCLVHPCSILRAQEWLPTAACQKKTIAMNSCNMLDSSI